MIKAFRLAMGDLADRSFRRVLWLSAALSALLLAGLSLGAHFGLRALSSFHWPWLNTAVRILGDAGIVVGGLLLFAPLASLFVGIFLEDIAVAIERKHYGADPPGRSLGFGPMLATALAFLGSVLLVNLLALPLYLVPGANLVLYLFTNGYLLGREYFELVGLRHRAPKVVSRLRRSNRLRIYGTGVIIALALLVPILNLLAPLFGTALMVHVFKEADAVSKAE